MKEEKRFKVGDHVTYKSHKDCYNSDYCYGGGDNGGYVGVITDYKHFNYNKSCWEISVTYLDGENYAFTMLESEFVEYDTPKNQDLFPIYQENQKRILTFVKTIKKKVCILKNNVYLCIIK